MLAQSKLAAPRAALLAATFVLAAGAFYAQQVPAGYPADYQKILDGAKKKARSSSIRPPTPRPPAPSSRASRRCTRT